MDEDEFESDYILYLYMQVGYSMRFSSRNPETVNTEMINVSVPVRGEFDEERLGIVRGRFEGVKIS